MDKKELYEKIMLDVGRIVKKHLNNYAAGRKVDIVDQVESAIDDYVLSVAEKAKKYLSDMDAEQLKKFQSDLNKVTEGYALIAHGIPSLLCLENEASVPHDPNRVAASVRDILKVDDFQVQVTDPFEIGIPNIGITKASSNMKMLTLIIDRNSENLRIADKFMALNGYTLIRRMNVEYPDKSILYVLIYSPVKRTDINNELADVEWLYHVSGRENRESILKNGLIAKPRYGTQEEGGIIYPERVFLYVDKTAAIDQKKSFKEAKYEADMYAIDRRRLSEFTKMYYDPLYGKNAVYVETNIPSNLIHII